MLDPAAQGAPEVHLWNLHLLAAAPREAELGRLLSPEERSRAERLHSERERRRFVVRRGRLRQILAQYLGGEPASIVLRAGSFGKHFMGRQERVVRWRMLRRYLRQEARNGRPFGTESGRQLRTTRMQQNFGIRSSWGIKVKHYLPCSIN